MSASREKRSRKGESSAELTTKAKKQDKKSGKLNDRFYTVITIVIAAVLVISLGVAVFQNVVFSGKNFVAADIGDEKVNPHEVNFYYVNSYLNFVNTYGSYLQYMGLNTSLPLDAQNYSEDKTWHEYFLDTALTSVQEVKMLSKEATANGVTLNEQFTQQIEADISSMESAVKEQNLTLAAYLSNYFGSSMTINEYKRILAESYLAQQYGQSVFDGFEYTSDQLKAHYDENKKDFDLVDYRYFFFSASPTSENPTQDEINAAKTNAKSLAEIMKSSVTDDKSFAALSLQNAPENSKELYEDEDYTLREGATYSSLSGTPALADWLFDTSRTYGDTAVIETDTGYYVVFMRARTRNDYNTANVRHILIQFDMDADQEEPTAEQIQAAKDAAQAILDEFNTGAKTEESFAELAKEHSEDPGSAANGGLYEGVYKGQMVSPFEDWTFASDRKPGDTGLVETEYGYHVMYYVSDGEPFWMVQVENTMRSNAYTEYSNSLREKNPIKRHSLGLMAVGLPK